MELGDSGRLDGARGAPSNAAYSPAIAAAAACGTLLAVFALHAPTLRSMAEVWAGSGTYVHGFLVIPASLWLIWQRREELHAAPVRPSLPGLLGVAAAGLTWLLGDLSASLSLTHFALVFLAIGVIVTVFGLGWARVLAFPLTFLVFAVPFGEAFVPVLMDWTADFTVMALKLSGVPVFREGTDLIIPSGRWSVVEACSGARYLLASLTAGTAYAWIMYRSPHRRVAFIVASIVVPVIANWLRAYMIVMLGHLSSNRLATGVDHFIYGWVFFGLVIFAMFVVGLRWREDGLMARWAPRNDHFQGLLEQRNRLIAAGLFAMGTVAVWPALSALLATTVDKRPVAPVRIDASDGWRETQAQSNEWRPNLAHPRATLGQHFQNGAARVSVHIGYFRDQGQGSELVNSEHRLASNDLMGWRTLHRALVRDSTATQERRVWSIALRNHDGRQIRVWHWYWLGGRWTTSDSLAKAYLAFDRLLMRSDTSAWIAVATELDPDVPQRSEAVLREFFATMGPALEAALSATAAR